MARPVTEAVAGDETAARTALAPLSVGQLLEAQLARLEAGPEYLATGWPRLDAALGGGLLVPSLTVLGAEPKCGKSTWVTAVAMHYVEAGGVAYVLDLENGRQRFLRRVLCAKAQVPYRDVRTALDGRVATFESREAAQRWCAAKAWLEEKLAGGLFVEFRSPDDFEARLAAVASAANGDPFLCVIDSLQKLPTDYTDRRASMDKWIRFFERTRGERGVFLVTSEIKRDLRGGYTAHGSAFKESGGIEYGADLGLTLERPDPDEELSTLRVEFARDCDEDPRGDIASYAPVRPHYGLEERDPVPRQAQKVGRKTDAAREWLAGLLAGRAVPVSEILADGEAAGFSRATVYRAREALGNVAECSVGLKKGWRRG